MFAKIGLDSSDYEKGLSSASGLTQSFGDKAKAALGTVGKTAAVGLTAATGAAVAFGKSAVDVGMSFDSSMAQVAATMGTTVGEITNLRDFAMEMGAKTAFSATQAADALNYMALAGYDAETSMNMLPNVLNLAAAGGMELAAASDMITDSQSALGLSLDETSALVDKMAKASSKSNTSVSQLGSAILTVGGTAKAMKGGTTELAQVLGIIADNGVKGAEGGTALRNIILSLTAPTDKAAKTLKSLGVSALDSSGNMRSMQDIFADLNKSLGDMTEGQKTAVLSEIFNKVDLKSVNALMGTNVERWNELTAAIDDSAGAAEAMANTQLDNLAGDITIFQSALEGAKILLSDQLTPALREFVQFGTDGITAVTDAFKREETVRGLSDAIRDAEGNLLSAGQVAGVLSETLYSMSESDRQIAIREIFNTDDMEYVNELLNENGENWGYLMGYVAEIDAASEATNGWAAAMGTLGPVVSDAVTMILEGLPQAVEVGGQLLGAVVTGIINAIPALADGALQVAGAFGGYLKGAMESALDSIGILEPVKESFSGVGEAFDRIGESVSPLIEKFTAWATSAETAQGAAGLLETGLTLLGNAVSGVAGFVADIVEVGAGFIDWLTTLWHTNEDLRNAIGSIWEAIQGFFVGAWEKIKSTWDAVKPYFSELWEQIKKTFSVVAEVLGGFFTRAWQVIQIAWSVAEPWFGLIWRQIERTFSVAEAVLGGFFSTAWAVIKTVWDAAIGFFQNIWNTIDGIFSVVEAVLSGDFSAAWEAIKGVFSGWGAYFHGLWNDLVGIFSAATSAFFNIGKNIVDGLLGGIKDAWSTLTGWVGNGINALKAKFTGKDGFDERSPSHWAERVGEYVSIGLANGIEKESTEAEKAAEKMVSGVQDELSEWTNKTAYSAMDRARVILPGVPSATSVPASITSGAYAYHAVPTSAASAPSILPDSSGYQAPIQVEIKAEPAPVMIDGREFARVIYQYFVEESNRQGRQLIVT